MLFPSPARRLSCHGFQKLASLFTLIPSLQHCQRMVPILCAHLCKHPISFLPASTKRHWPLWIMASRPVLSLPPHHGLFPPAIRARRACMTAAGRGRHAHPYAHAPGRCPELLAPGVLFLLRRTEAVSNQQGAGCLPSASFPGPCIRESTFPEYHSVLFPIHLVFSMDFKLGLGIYIRIPPQGGIPWLRTASII